MMTRRMAALLALGIPAWGFESKEFWIQKKPSEWTDAEIHQLLTQSPWARAATVNNTAKNGPLGGPRGAVGGGGGRRGGGSRGGAAPTGAASSGPGQDFKATVRWESALPIREAMRAKLTPDLEENYVVEVVGDIPSVGIPTSDDSPAERKAKLEALQDTTHLDRRDEPIDLKKAELSPTGTLFYFSRVFRIKPEDKLVTFVTKMGPLEIKCKFPLKDMTYHGGLEL